LAEVRKLFGRPTQSEMPPWRNTAFALSLLANADPFPALPI